MFIAFPLPGDNNGHGGFKDGVYFQKIENAGQFRFNYWVNVVCLLMELLLFSG